jgi:phage tail protein X
VKVPGFLLPQRPAWRSNPAGVAAGLLFFILAGGLIIYYLAMNWISLEEEQKLHIWSRPANRRDTRTAQTGQGNTAGKLNRLPAQQPDNSPSSKGVEGGAPSPPHDSRLSVGANGDEAPMRRQGDVQSEFPFSKGGQGDVSGQFPLAKGGSGDVPGGSSAVHGSPGDPFQPNPARQYLTIIVAPGETLHQICLHYLGRYSNNLVEEIMELNPRLKAPNHVEAGQRLRLPLPAVPEMTVISGTDEPVARRGREPRKSKP